MATALSFFIVGSPADSGEIDGTHTGMSPHGATCCAARNSAETQVNVASEPLAFFEASSKRPMVGPSLGPAAL